MKDNEFNYYNKIKNWDFSQINCEIESLTNWDLSKILNEKATKKSRILDLGTGGGEILIDEFPEALEIVGTDFSLEMIKTANKNLKKANKKNIKFRIMNNLNMDTEDNYFDIVVARNTCIDARQIYKTLKKDGLLLVRGVDKLDCWQLKRLFNRGQAFNDIKPISQIDYENILDAGFKNVELIPIYEREYYKTNDDLLALLLKTPILNDFSEEHENNNLIENNIDKQILNQYIENNTTNKGILLRRRYYGIIANK